MAGPSDQVLSFLSSQTDWLTSQQVYEHLKASHDMKQVTNCLYRLTLNGSINKKTKGGRNIYKYKNGTTVPIVSAKAAVAPTPSDASLDNALEAVSVIAADRETYRNALLQIKAIIDQALGVNDSGTNT